MKRNASSPRLISRSPTKKKLITGYKADLSKLVIKGSEEEIKHHGKLTTVRLALQSKIEEFRKQGRAFQTLQDEVKNMRLAGAPEMLRNMQSRFPNSGLDGKQWAEFLLDYAGPVDDQLPGYIKWANNQISTLNGVVVVPPEDGKPLLGAEDDLSKATLSQFDFEIARLEGLLQADKQIRDQFGALSKRIGVEQREHDKLAERLKDAQGAAERRKVLQRERGETYQRIFEAIVSEEKALADLYAPLQERLERCNWNAPEVESDNLSNLENEHLGRFC